MEGPGCRIHSLNLHVDKEGARNQLYQALEKFQ